MTKSMIFFDIQKSESLSETILFLLNKNVSGVTDIYVSSNEPIAVRLTGNDWRTIIGEDRSHLVFGVEQLREFIDGIYGVQSRDRIPLWETILRKKGSLHAAAVLGGVIDGEECTYRVRCTIQRQSMGSGIGVVIRALPPVIPKVEDLGLPGWVATLITQGFSSGLVVVTGPTGAGKSTTLAALLDQINATRHSHILTIEDPIEYEFERKNSIVTQRELMVDVLDFAQGVKDALRFVPDVILVGETRDSDTMQSVVRAAESGHLVMTSMHAPSAIMAISKMQALLGNNPGDLVTLAQSLSLVIAQYLVRDTSGEEQSTDNKVLVYEILDCRNRIVQDYLLGNNNVMAQNVQKALNAGQLENSFSWDTRLKQLVQSGQLSPRRAAQLTQDAELKRQWMGAGPSMRTR